MKANQPGFYITNHKGFHVVFENGWTVSVQFGPGNYCSNYDVEISHDGDDYAGKRGSDTAEVAAWPISGDMIGFGGDTVAGYQTPAQVLALMNWVAAQPETGGATVYQEAA